MTPSGPNCKCYRRARPGLGTIVVLSIEDVSLQSSDKLSHKFSHDFPRELIGEFVEKVFTSAWNELERLEKIFNFFDETSELSRLNQRNGRASEPDRDSFLSLSPELSGVLKLASRVESVSRGAFRLMPNCPHPAGQCLSWVDESRVDKKGNCVIDLGGIAKGAIVDLVFEHLQSLVPHARITVNAGGDLRTSEPQPVEIRVPAPDGERRFGVEIPAAAIATSSLGLDDFSVGRASAHYSEQNRKVAAKSGLASATVVATTCAVADAWTKVVLLNEERRVSGAIEKAASDMGVLALYQFDREGAWAP